MINKFDALIKYSAVDKIDDLTLEYAIYLLNTYINNDNSHIFSQIDYEMIFFLEKLYSNDPQFNNLLSVLKEKIANNWETKQRLMARYTLKGKTI